MKELDGGTEDGRTDKDAELLEILVLKRKMFSKYKAPMGYGLYNDVIRLPSISELRTRNLLTLLSSA